jgi:hypothetical protein
VLESAQDELRQLEQALLAAAERERQGRGLVQASARTGELPDRLAGLVESRAADRYTAALTPHIAQAELEVTTRLEEFIAKRVEHRQAETLIEETEARDAIDANRRSQQSLDEWYRSRLPREKQNPAASPLTIFGDDPHKASATEFEVTETKIKTTATGLKSSTSRPNQTAK